MPWGKRLRLGKGSDHRNRWKVHRKEETHALSLRLKVSLKTALPA